MTVPIEYANHYAPVKYFLSSYRALSDGRGGVHRLGELLEKESFFLRDWKVLWIGTCATLRTAVYMMKKDAESCLAPSLREEILAEFNSIGEQKEKHKLFHGFLRLERNGILKDYEWQAYETWMKPDGTFRAANLSLLAMLKEDDARPFLLMKSGPFKGHNSLDLLRESADWLQDRIFSAIRRAGLDPEERRGLVDFRQPPKATGTLLGGEITE